MENRLVSYILSVGVMLNKLHTAYRSFGAIHSLTALYTSQYLSFAKCLPWQLLHLGSRWAHGVVALHSLHAWRLVWCWPAQYLHFGLFLQVCGLWPYPWQR